jgi:hypothetical protein
VLRVAEAAIQSDFDCGATGIQEELLGPLETQTVHKAQGWLSGTFAKSPHEMPGTDTGNLRQALDRERPRQVGLDVVGVSVRRETEKLMGKMVFERLARFQGENR